MPRCKSLKSAKSKKKLKKTLDEWYTVLHSKYYYCNIYYHAEINKQVKEAENIDNNYLPISSTFSTNLETSYETHSEAIFIYTSRLLDFDNLPEPKNSENYYEENDDIISIK